MNLGLRKVISSLVSNLNCSYVPVRHRYYAEKIARGPIAKKFGYEEKIFKGGLLGRIKDAPRLSIPLYKPGNAWTEEKATFGQNDYIDILGGGKIKPPYICYDVPRWLRGKKGNEYQLLLLKAKCYSKTWLQYDYPKAWNNINKRLRYLHKYLNTKTKTSFMKE